MSAFGRISSPPAGNIDHSAAKLPKPHPAALFSPRSASILPSTSPRVASTSPKIGRRPVRFLRFGVLRHMHDAPRTSNTGTNPSNDHRRGIRLLREPIGQHTPLLSEPDRPSRDPLGLRAPCSRSSCWGSFLVVLAGKEQAVLVECLIFFVWLIFSVLALSYVFQYMRRSVLRIAQIAAPFLLKIV